MGKEYLDSSLKPEIRAKALLKEMSLEEKVAQLTGVFPFDEEYNEKLKGVSRMESLELILANGRGRVWSEEEKVRMAEKKNDNYKELIKQITPADLLPGIEEFLRELRDNGIRIALASVSKNAPFIF